MFFWRNEFLWWILFTPRNWITKRLSGKITFNPNLELCGPKSPHFLVGFSSKPVKREKKYVTHANSLDLLRIKSLFGSKSVNYAYFDKILYMSKSFGHKMPTFCVE